MSDSQDPNDQALSAAKRKALVKALVKVMRDEERRDERMKQLRERSAKR